MRFLSIIITLAIIGYAMSLYLDSGKMTTDDSEQKKSKPKEYIDHAQQAKDQINKTLQDQQKRLDQLNQSK